MKTFFLPLASVFMLCAYPLTAEEKFESIEDAVAGLADDQYAQREAATIYLWTLGKDIKPKLLQLAEERDPEVRLRAREILENLKSGILPSTDPQVREIAKEYRSANGNEKLKLLQRLNELKAYKQIFALYNAEPEPEEQGQLQFEMERMTPTILKSLLSEDKADDALSLLSLSPVTYANSRRWATIVVGLKDEAKKEKILQQQFENKNELRNQYNLLAYGSLTNDLKLTSELVNREGMKRFKVRERLFAGDFEAYANWLVEESKGEQLTLYLKGRSALEAGNQKQFQAVVKELLELANKGESARKRSIRFLTALGSVEDALSLRKESEFEDFKNFLISRSDWKRLFSLVDLPFDEKGLDKILESRKKKDLSEIWELDRSQKPSQIVSFLYNLKEAERLIPSLEAYLSELEQAEKMTYLDSFKRNNYFYLFLMLHERNAELLTQAELEELIIEPYPFAVYLNGLVKEHLPELGLPKTVRLILELGFGQIYGESQAESISQLADKAEEKAKGNQRVQMHYITLLKQAGYQERLAAFLLQELENKPTLEAYFEAGAQQIYLNQWDRALECMEKVNELAKGGQTAYLKLFYMATLHRTNQQELANQLMEEFMQTSLNNPQDLLNAARVFQQCGLTEQSIFFLEKGLKMIDPLEGKGRYWNQFVTFAAQLYNENEDLEMALTFQKVKLLHILQRNEASSRHNGLLFIQTTAEELVGQRYREDLFTLKWKASKGEFSPEKVARISEYLSGHGVLADELFPFLSEKNKSTELKKIADRSLDKLKTVIERFPNRITAKNTFAWLSARGAYRLEEGERYIDEVLELEPRNGAYLDTKAEISFAQQKREEALSYSERAWKDSFNSGDPMIKLQYSHFENDPFPAELKK